MSGATAGGISDVTLFNELGNLHSPGNATTQATFDATAGTVHTIAGPDSLHGFSGLSLGTVTDVDFGAQLTFSMTGSNPDTIAIDHVQMRIYYTEVISVSLTESISLDDGTVEDTQLISVSLTESLSLNDNNQAFPITSTTLFGDNFICLDFEYSSFSAFESNTATQSCQNIASVKLSPTNSDAHDMVAF